ncbi:MAG: DUF2273 domain-containing protein [Tissierellia bacterium]|nr:DUF2273 domain-containing protein [Tissierellia bacterium]
MAEVRNLKKQKKSLENTSDVKTFGEYDVEMEKIKRKDLRNEYFKKVLGIYKHRVIALLIALITSICLISLGFWRTLLIWIVMLIGYSIGAWYDKDRTFLKFIRRFFEN